MDRDRDQDPGPSSSSGSKNCNLPGVNDSMSSPVKAFIAAAAADPTLKQPKGRYCVVVGCHNNTHRDGARGVKFHLFPKDSERRKKWISAVRRSNPAKPTELWQPSSSSLVCSQHFLGGKKSNDPGSPAFVPSVFPTHTTKTPTLAGMTKKVSFIP